jgi:ribonuclease III
MTKTKTERPRPEDLAALEARMGYRFRDADLLDLALTHRSFSHESGRPARDNESMEFLGDAVLGLVMASRLFEASRGRRVVGDLARRRAALVSESSLAANAAALGIGAALRLGIGEEGSGGRAKPSLLADALEAVIAAIYLDGGLDAAREFILARFEVSLSIPRAASADLDPKTRLQEKLQARGWPAPAYRVVGTSGPDHERRFTVEVLVRGQSVARGEGASKKAAGVEAAREALKRWRSILAKTGGA